VVGFIFGAQVHNITSIFWRSEAGIW